MPDAHDSSDIHLPGAPNIAGLRFRPFRGADDYPHMLAVRAGCLAHDALDPHSARDPLPTLAELAHGLADSAPGDPRLLLAEMAGAVIGYARRGTWTEEGDIHVYLHLEYLVPQWRGQGIGAALLRWAEMAARAEARAHPTGGAAILATNAAASEREKTATIARLGYQPVRHHIEMRADDLSRSPAAALPAGCETRPVTPDQYPAIYAMFRDAWAGKFGTLAKSDAAYQDFLDENVRAPGADPSLWCVAWHGAEVVGAVVGRASRDSGYIDEVATRTAWQRQGIARALLGAVLAAFAERGLSTARLFTDADDGQGARTLYERAGFRPTAEHILYRKPLAEEPTRAADADDLPF